MYQMLGLKMLESLYCSFLFMLSLYKEVLVVTFQAVIWFSLSI